VSPRFALARAAQQRHGGDIVDDLAMREEPGVLHHVADAPTKRHGFERRDIRAVDEDLTAGGVDHAVDHAEERRLARSGGADEHGRLVRRDDDVDVFDCDGAIGELLGDAAELDHANLNPVGVVTLNNGFQPNTIPATRQRAQASARVASGQAAELAARTRPRCSAR
jgi:hypothetical protein